ncbi:hypothetical protein PG999_008432 [Apiospora kogelbergensis]|uniref:Ankyrin repeat-containing protein n=1 Tax=Apiospora kogelbergensis TaxID=1337665 RepID=A0AAW0QKH8_9PEZI
MLQLPTELVLDITTRVDSLSDLLHLGQTCRRLLPLFLDELFTRDVQNWNSSALLWACQRGNIATARRSLEAGTSVDHLFFEALPTFGMDPSDWAPWVKRDTDVSCLAGHPLAIAVQYRHAAMVRFLLEEGADPNQNDAAALTHNGHVWYPIHWAMTCQTMQRKQHCDITATSTPIPIQNSSAAAHLNPPDLAIVALLLHHGADPDQPTVTGPRRSPDDEASVTHTEPLHPVHFTGCNHVPVAALQLLLEHGADPRASSRVWPCAAPHRTGRGAWHPGLFEYFKPLWPFASEKREAKLLLAARHGGEDRRRWKFDLGATRSTLHAAPPSRLRLWLFLTGSTEVEPTVLGSGVYAALDAWTAQKALAVAAGKRDGLHSDDALCQAEALGLLETLIARLVGVRRIKYSDEAVLIEREKCESVSCHDSTPTVGLAEAFRSFCESAGDSSDTSPFIAVLADHGVHPEHEGRQLTLSETIERKLAPKARSLLRIWPKDLVPWSHTNYGIYKREVDDSGVTRFHCIGSDKEATQEAEKLGM